MFALARTHFVVELVLGLVRRATGSLQLCMFVHAVCNAWAIAIALRG